MKYFAILIFTIMLAGFPLPANSNFQGGINLLDQKAGTIKGHTLVYDEFDRREGYTGSVKVYYKNNQKKKELIHLTIADNYLSEVKLLHLKKGAFIYIGTTHTYGHSEGFLYFLNMKEMKTYAVKITTKKGVKIPDSLYVHKSFELSLNHDKTFGSSALVRSKKGNYQGIWEIKYYLKQLKNNTFTLVGGKSSLGESY